MTCGADQRRRHALNNTFALLKARAPLPPQLTSGSHVGMVPVSKDFPNFQKARDKSRRIRRYGGYLLEPGLNEALHCAPCFAGLSRKHLSRLDVQLSNPWRMNEER